MQSKTTLSIQSQTISSPSQMMMFGQELVKQWVKKLGIIWNLGAGKTHLTKGFAQWLGIDPDQVHSPTYVYFHEYHGNTSWHDLLHVDMYRIKESFHMTKIWLSDKLSEYEYRCIERPVIEWIDEPDLVVLEITIIDEHTRRVEIISTSHQEQTTTPHVIRQRRISTLLGQGILSSTFVRYFIGGVLSALIDLFFLYCFTEFLNIHYLISQILSFGIAFFFGFWFQKTITFRDRSDKHLTQWARFLIFQLIGLWFNILILHLMVDTFGVYYLLWSIVAKGVVFFRNFSMNKRFNFA